MSKRTGDFSGNKGEWSEVYVFLKLLADGKLHGADKNGNPIPYEFFKVLKVKHGTVEALSGTGKIVTFCNSLQSVVENKITIQKNSKELFDSISNGVGTLPSHKKGSFLIPNMEVFLRKVGYMQLIVKGTKKRDINVQTDDQTRGQKPYLGYSIKSEIGGPPTLLNASRATNIVFLLDGLSQPDVSTINSMYTLQGKTDIIQRCNYIKSKISLPLNNIRFEKFNNPKFQANLEGLDDGLPEIITSCVYAHYFENCKTSEDLISYLKHTNPRHYSPANLSFYETKYKRFLRSAALGMKPSFVWNDEDDATGGYIIAKPNGELVAFFIYNRKLLDEYLYKRTFFERGSATKHNFMRAYMLGNQVYINLNLQIRFKL